MNSILMRNIIIRSMVMGLALAFMLSCATVEETPEVIVILPEGEMEGDVGKINFAKKIKPILVGKCLSCHHPNSEVTDISFASREDMLDASEGTAPTAE